VTSSHGKPSLPCRRDAIYYDLVACRALCPARDFDSLTKTATAKFVRRPMKKKLLEPKQSGQRLSRPEVRSAEQVQSDNQDQYRWGSSVGESGGFITRRSGVQLPPPPLLTVARFRVRPFLYAPSRVVATAHFRPAKPYGLKRRQVAASVAARCH
jgi:hypothetical protein